MKNRTYVFLCIVFIFHSSSWAQLPLSILWEKSLGGSNNDEAYDIQNTNDGGYIVAGITYSIDGDVTVQKGYGDYWLVKLDSSGEIQQQKSYGGSGEDIAKSVQQTSDSGYIICGWSASFDQDISNHIGLWDIWVVKTDENGNIQWEKSLGGTDWEFSWSIQQTYDDGFIITGWSWSDDGDITVHYGSWLSSDIWIVKLDSSGNLEWQKTLGGSDTDRAPEVVQTSDSGYAVAGYSASDDIDVSRSPRLIKHF